jgi:hypothetical protein
VSDTVRQFLSVLGTALFSMGHPGHYYNRFRRKPTVLTVG